jgi:glutathione S-transferase
MTASLYCFGESGNAYKCALAMTLAGYPWQPVFVDFFNGEARSPAFREINEMGEVPVLVDDGRTLTQSGVILNHIVRKTGQFGGAPEDADEVLRWILWDNHKHTGTVSTLRFLGNFLAPEKRPEGVIPFLQGRAKAAWKVLDTHLANRDWVVGRSVTVADFSCCSYLYYPEPFGFDRSDWPNIARWLDRISALPGWKHPYDLMPGRPSDRA